MATSYFTAVLLALTRVGGGDGEEMTAGMEELSERRRRIYVDGPA